MNPVDEAWRHAVNAASVLTAVEARLVNAGALSELRHLHGFSAQEQDVLVHREVHDPCSQALPSGCPQTPHAEVAA